MGCKAAQLRLEKETTPLKSMQLQRDTQGTAIQAGTSTSTTMKPNRVADIATVMTTRGPMETTTLGITMNTFTQAHQARRAKATMNTQESMKAHRGVKTHSHIVLAVRLALRTAQLSLAMVIMI